MAFAVISWISMGRCRRASRFNMQNTISGVSRPQKHRSSPYTESDHCYRREKGFPGIQVALNQEIIKRRNHVQVLHENECLMFTSSRKVSRNNGYLHAESHNMPSLSNYSSSYRNLLSESQLENTHSGGP
ncbi:hypothetical protein EJB05_20672, partial [Eragrostis curvula]